MIDCEKIDDYLWGDETEDEAEFKINSDVLADWAIKKIKAEQDEHDRLVEIAKVEIEELNKQIEKLNQSLESKTGFLKGKLQEYFNTVEHKETKTQSSYKLLSGSLVFKKPSQKMIPDKDKLLDYIKNNNLSEFIKVKEEVDWAGYKKECQIMDGKVINNQTGEVIDCISVEDVPGDFGVKI